MRTFADLTILWGIFWLGTALGSFLNVCIYRLPRKKSIVRPGSCCPHCGGKIRIWDNIPVLSYIILAGRCRYCKTRIPFRYPLVEILTALIVSALFIVYGWSFLFLHYLLLSLFLILASFIDVEHKLILNGITLPGIILGWGLIIFLRPISISDSLLGFAIGAGFLYFVAILGEILFHKESMGGGDIKLAAMVGIFLGWKATVVALFLAFLAAAVYGINYMVWVGAKKDSAISFGPFISLGAFIFLFFGDDILKAYTSVFLS